MKMQLKTNDFKLMSQIELHSIIEEKAKKKESNFYPKKIVIKNIIKFTKSE